MTRKNTARATELLFIAGHSVLPDAVIKEFRRSRRGGTFCDGVADFEWGNIKSLIAGDLHAEARVSTVTDEPRFIYHLDRLPKMRRKFIEERHLLPSRSISGSLTDSKADVLIVDKSGKVFMVSFKELEGNSKLGQVSADTEYGAAKLEGGLGDLDVASLPIPTKIDSSDTELTASEFAKATAKDKKLAYYKKNHSKAWNEYVARRSMAARRNLELCGLTLCEDRYSFIEFLGKVLGGTSRESGDFHIVLGDELVHLQTVLGKLSDARWQITMSDSSTKGKHAILLTVNDGVHSYSLTRIEQSFEGAKADVIQTKGIIFHFQQHPRSGMNYKQLLLDLR